MHMSSTTRGRRIVPLVDDARGRASGTPTERPEARAPRPTLDNALREAARANRYVPHLQGGKPVTFRASCRTCSAMSTPMSRARSPLPASATPERIDIDPAA